MVLGETRRECRLNFFEIASSHGRADIHPVGMQGFEPAEAAPSFEDPSSSRNANKRSS